MLTAMCSVDEPDGGMRSNVAVAVPVFSTWNVKTCVAGAPICDPEGSTVLLFRLRLLVSYVGCQE
jgi:hypothetical protein